jgi:hypothetical protein
MAENEFIDPYASLVNREPRPAAQEFTEARPPIPAGQVGPTRAAAANLRPLKIDYDVEAAVQGGLTSADIAQYLADETNYDYAGARAAGIGDDEIIAELSTARRPTAAGAVAEGVTRGVVGGGPAMAGGITGAALGLQAGTAAAPFLGPLAPAGPAAGFILGGTIGTIAGLVSGQGLESGLEDVGLLPEGPLTPDRRPLMEGGRTFGAGAPTIFAPGIAVRNMPLGPTAFLARQAPKTTQAPQTFAEAGGGIVKRLGRGAGAAIQGAPVLDDAGRVLQPRFTPLDRILGTAAQSPRSFFAAETAALGSAAAAGTAAETADPGNTYLRMAAEITAGAANPIALSSRGMRAARTAIGNTLNRFSEGGRERLIGQKLFNILENAGEDPQAVIRALLADDELSTLAAEAGVDLGARTPAIKTGSPTLAALQRTIAQNNERVGPTVARAAEQNLAGIAKLIDLMVELDDPSILAAAGQLRDDYYQSALQLRLDQASAQAAETAGRILSDDPTAGQAAGQAVEKLVRDSLKDARNQETALYARVDLRQPAAVDNIATEFNTIREGLLPESPFPALITRFVNRTTADDAEVTLRDLTNFRSEMLSMARDARAAGSFRDANFYGRMAEAALEDIGLRAEARPGGIDPNIPMMRSPNERALANAYAFSKSLNDVFTRSFAGDVLATKRTGADRIPPELLAGRIFGTGGDATSFRIAQLEEAVQFMHKNSNFFALSGNFAETSSARLGTLRAAEQDILRLAAQNSFNPETGRVNPVSLARFMQNNAASLEKFPQLRSDLTDARTAEQLLRNVIDANSIEAKAIANQGALRAVLGNDETPAGAIAIAIGEPGSGRSPDAVKNLRGLVKLVNTSGEIAPQARAGLKDAVLDRAIVYATSPEGEFNFNRFRNFLMEPMSRGQPSTIGVLRDGGILSDAEATRLNTFLREADRIQEAINAGGTKLDDVLIDAPGATYDLVVSFLGSALGRTAGERFTGRPGGLIEAGRGIKFTQSIFSRMPSTYFRNIVDEAVTNSEFMAVLLTKGRPQTVVAQRRFNNQLNGFLTAAGLIALPEQEEGVIRGPVLDPFAGQAPADTAAATQDLQNYLDSVAPPPAAPPQVAPSAPPPAAPVQAPPPSPPPSQQGAAAQPGASYAALFPNDPIASILQQREMQQGIGSLAGPR